MHWHKILHVHTNVLLDIIITNCYILMYILLSIILYTFIYQYFILLFYINILYK